MQFTENTRMVATWLVIAACFAAYKAYDLHTTGASTRGAAHAGDEVNAALKAGPTTRSWDTGQGTVIEVSIPVDRIGGVLEQKHCTVWRDKETRTASLACEAPALILDTTQ